MTQSIKKNLLGPKVAKTRTSTRRILQRAPCRLPTIYEDMPLTLSEQNNPTPSASVSVSLTLQHATSRINYFGPPKRYGPLGRPRRVEQIGRFKCITSEPLKSTLFKERCIRTSLNASASQDLKGDNIANQQQQKPQEEVNGTLTIMKKICSFMRLFKYSGNK